MAWSGPRTASSRRTGTRAWRTIRLIILERDGWQCTRVVDGHRCERLADEVDHVVPVSAGGTDEPDNLVSLCVAHHRAKTATEAHRTEPGRLHPGLIR